MSLESPQAFSLAQVEHIEFRQTPCQRNCPVRIYLSDFTRKRKPIDSLLFATMPAIHFFFLLIKLVAFSSARLVLHSLTSGSIRDDEDFPTFFIHYIHMLGRFFSQDLIVNRF